MAAYLACQSVAGVGVFPRHIWHKTSFIPTCVKSRSLPVNKARWRNHVTDLRWVQYSWSHGSVSRDGSASQCDGPGPPGPAGWRLGREARLKFPTRRRMTGRLGWWRVSRGARLGSEWRARDRGRPSRRGWPSTWWWRPSRRLLTQHMRLTTQHMLQKRFFNFLSSVWVTGRPSQREPWQPKKSVASSVSVVGRPSYDGSEHHRSRNGYCRQGVTSQLSRLPQQGTLQLQDRSLPCYLMSAVCSACQWPSQQPE